MNAWCKYALVTASWAACALVFADDDVVLQAGEFAVTTQDFDRYLTAQGITGAKRDRTLAKQGAVQAVFENIYVIRAFAAKGEKNPSIDQADINWQVADFKARLLMTEHLKLEVQSALRATDWDAVAKEHYTANKAKYQTRERVSAAHILISSNDRTRDEAQALANNVAVRLQAGEEFEALAQEYSDDKGSATKGGDLGAFPRDAMVKPFEDAVFAMTEEGEISVPVETQYGYHIIRFNERAPGRQRSFEEAKPDIMPTLKATAAQEARQAQIATMQNGALDGGLQVNRLLLNEYVQRYSTDAEANSKK